MNSLYFFSKNRLGNHSGKVISDKIIFLIAALGGVILTFTFQLTLFSNGFYALSADESGHTLHAYNWYKGNEGFFSIWLPFQKIFLGLIFNLSSDLFIVPRIVSFSFGILTLLALSWLALELFNQKTVSLITLLLGSFFSPIIVLSVVPMLEIIFSFFTVMAMIFLVRLLSNDNRSNLYLCCLFSALSATIRFEGWIFSLTIFFIIVFYYLKENGKRNNFIKIVPAAAILCLFPLVWIVESIINTGSAFGFASSVAERYNEGTFFSELKNNVLYQFMSININSLNIVGLISLIYLFRIPKIRRFSYAAFIPLIILSLLMFFSKAMPTHNYWRIASVWLILLLPFTSFWLFKQFLSNEISNSFVKIGFVLFVILISLFFINQTLSLSKLSYFTQDDLSAGRYFKSLQLDEADKILIKASGWKYSNVLIASNNPSLFLLNIPHVDERTNNKAYFNLGDIEFERLIENQISYIVVSDTLLQKQLGGNKNIGLVKEYREWTIFKVKEK